MGRTGQTKIRRDGLRGALADFMVFRPFSESAKSSRKIFSALLARRDERRLFLERSRVGHWCILETKNFSRQKCPFSCWDPFFSSLDLSRDPVNGFR